MLETPWNSSVMVDIAVFIDMFDIQIALKTSMFKLVSEVYRSIGL